jgi:predicted Zn-dependent protease
LFLSGIDRFHRQDLAGAASDFENVLIREPEHFLGRFFQAVCFLRLKRPGEAKVALTACIGQRPHFAWNYFFRGQACVQMGETSSAAQDFQRGLETDPNEPIRSKLLANLNKLVPEKKVSRPE